MNNKLFDILNDRENNCVIPFYWQQGNHYDAIPAQIDEIYSSGARAFCVESRVHPDFCGESWRRDMQRILEEAKARDMRVWILDDKCFPTGRANDMIKNRYPDLRPWRLTERHVDVIGPSAGMALLYDENAENVLYGAFAYRRENGSETLPSKAADVTERCENGYLRWDVPEGVWRIFFLYKTRRGDADNQDNYIDMLEPRSVDVLIDAVYEEHYRHFKGFFGNTLVGFFSDEPGFANGWAGKHTVDKGMYNMRLGMEGLALPWHEEVRSLMRAALGKDVLPLLPALWYDMGEITGDVRYAYMDAITSLYRDNFGGRIGDWCKAHGVMHIGHIIEDMNTDSRLGVGCGHYFRAMEDQDMSGMDIVLHQVMPGLGQYIHTSSTFGGKADPEFFQYLLPKMCVSLAKYGKKMQGRAFCEIFGAYGWAESISTMKWLIDFLLVRGINHFVPHAFSPSFPNPDCPPHFGCEGKDPQFDGFSKLMRYANKASHLFYGSTPVVNASVLYSAEAEWMNVDGEYMLSQKPVKVLYNEHIDVDIITADMLSRGLKSDGIPIVVPYAKRLPSSLISALKRESRNREIIFVDAYPDDVDFGEVSALDDLPSCISRDISVEGGYPLLRCRHVISEGTHIFMFFNESVREKVSTMVRIGVTGVYGKADILNGSYMSGHTEDGTVKIDLEPYQSCVLVFDECGFHAEKERVFIKEIRPKFTVCIASYDEPNVFRFYKETDSPFNMNGRDEIPDFAGTIRYEGVFNVSESGMYSIEWDEVGEMIRLYLNDEDVGLRICKPWSFDILCKKGENKIAFEIATTLAYKFRDGFSYWMQLSPTGYSGKIRLYKHFSK